VLDDEANAEWGRASGSKDAIHCPNKTAIFVCLPRMSVYNAAEQLCPNGRIQPMAQGSTRIYDKAMSDLKASFKPHRRVYQNLSLTGSSPSFWYSEMKTGAWGARLGCPELD